MSDDGRCTILCKHTRCLCIARCEESGYMDCYNTELCRDQELHSPKLLLLVQLITISDLHESRGQKEMVLCIRRNKVCTYPLHSFI